MDDMEQDIKRFINTREYMLIAVSLETHTRPPSSA